MHSRSEFAHSRGIRCFQSPTEIGRWTSPSYPCPCRSDVHPETWDRRRTTWSSILQHTWTRNLLSKCHRQLAPHNGCDYISNNASRTPPLDLHRPRPPDVHDQPFPPFSLTFRRRPALSFSTVTYLATVCILISISRHVRPQKLAVWQTATRIASRCRRGRPQTQPSSYKPDIWRAFSRFLNTIARLQLKDGHQRQQRRTRFAR